MKEEEEDKRGSRPLIFLSPQRSPSYRKPEGGERNELPQWAGKINFEEKKGMIRDYLGGIREKIQHRTESDREKPYVFLLKLNPQAHSKASRKAIAKLFDSKRESSISSIIGLESEDELLVKISGESGLEKILDRLRESDGKSYESTLAIASIDSIKDFSPKIPSDLNVERPLRIKLIDYQDKEEDASLKKEFLDLCGSNGISVDEVKISDTRTIFKAKLSDISQLLVLKGFGGIREIGAMPELMLM